MERAPWIERCATRLLTLRPDVDTGIVEVVAVALWLKHPADDPAAVAELEARDWLSRESGFAPREVLQALKSLG